MSFKQFCYSAVTANSSISNMTTYSDLNRNTQNQDGKQPWSLPINLLTVASCTNIGDSAPVEMQRCLQCERPPCSPHWFAQEQRPFLFHGTWLRLCWHHFGRVQYGQNPSCLHGCDSMTELEDIILFPIPHLRSAKVLKLEIPWCW